MIDKASSIMLAFCALVLLIYPQNLFGQKSSKNRTGCAVNDKTKPSLYITYERVEADRQNVLLHLYNNTSCAIIVETPDINPEKHGTLFKRKVTKLSNGGIKTEYVLDWPPEGAMLPIYYDHHYAQQNNEPEPTNYSDGHLVFTLTIPSVRSVIFSVDIDYLKKGFNISVPFYYEWEQGPRIEPITHRVHFNALELPDGVIQRAGSQK